MTCLEHLIENCLVKFEDKETRFLDTESMYNAQKYYRIKQDIDEIRESIKNDPNLQYAGITADQCYEICQYIYYSYVPYIIDKQCGADMEEGEK